jgi:hypothetical protein
MKLCIRGRNEIAIIFVLLAALSSIPNVGNFFDETVCSSRPCPTVRLENPVILPYSWLFPEKKCNYCNFAESFSSVLYVNYFPLIHILNLITGLAFLLILSIFIHCGLNKIRKSLLQGGRRKG